MYCYIVLKIVIYSKIYAFFLHMSDELYKSSLFRTKNYGSTAQENPRV